MTWTQKHGIQHILIEPGSPTQNAYIEGFNGTLRDECLHENWFESREQARQAIATWRTKYNQIRPHSRFGRIPPATIAALNRQLTGDSKLNNPDTGIRSANLDNPELLEFRLVRRLEAGQFLIP
jgi:putative transposase